MRVFDQRQCLLGEGPHWHPEREQLLWCDILNKRLLARDGASDLTWQLDEYVSALGWIDKASLVTATDTGLWRFDLDTGDRDLIVSIEEDLPNNRSNDGFVDPWGGFWVSTMSLTQEEEAGSIYRYLAGECRKIVADITIPNAISFATDRSCAYYTDTATQVLWRVELDGNGWPSGSKTVLRDFSADDLNPDGAIVDAENRIWIALWGAGRVDCLASDGSHVSTLDVPAIQPTRPAFGGPNLTDLYVTSASRGCDGDQDGQTFVFQDVAQGLPEPKFVI